MEGPGVHGGGRHLSGLILRWVHLRRATRHPELVVLPLQEEDPQKARWFGVTLRCSSGHAVLLGIRADNLYLCSYRCPAGRWWEFRGSTLVDGMTPLSFTCSCGDMARAAGTALEVVTLDREELEAAARQLAVAGANAGSQQETARSLGHMMYNPERRGALPAHMVEQVKNWRSLSENWLGAVLYGQPFLPYIEADGRQRYGYIPQHLLAPAKIVCQDHAMAALGVALQDKNKLALDEHWRALARKFDKARN